MTNQKLINELKRFRESAINIAECWENTENDLQDKLNGLDSYPFDKSFNEEVLQIMNWVEDMINIISDKKD